MSIHHSILVIDEDREDLRLLSDAHKDLEIKNPLVIFHECEEVMPYLQSQSLLPKLIICDYRFRTMNGTQLKQQILDSNNARLKQIPFVIWSSVIDPIEKNELDELDIQALILKPSTYCELLSTYSHVIHKWGKHLHNMDCVEPIKSWVAIPSFYHPLNFFSQSALMI